MENIDNNEPKHNLPHLIGQMKDFLEGKAANFDFKKKINITVVGQDTFDHLAYDCFKNDTTIILHPVDNEIGFGIQWQYGLNDLAADDINDEDDFDEELTGRVIEAFKNYETLDISEEYSALYTMMKNEIMSTIIELVVEASVLAHKLKFK